MDTMDMDTISTTNADDTLTITIDEDDITFLDDYNTVTDVSHGYNNDLIISENSDIIVGTQSLRSFMKQVEERLNILQPNIELEEKWEELANLRKQYIELEKELLEKDQMWEFLKKE